MTRRFALLDRDGTVNVEKHYLSDPDQLELIPGAAAGMRRLQELGLGLAVITNQSGVARGYFDLARLDLIHARLKELLEAEGIHIAGIYVCPHGPDEDCACRKPLPGMVEQAAAELGFDPKQAFVVGDKMADVELGKAIGATAILVRTGHGAKEVEKARGRADYIAADLGEAALEIARRLKAAL